MAKRYLSIWFPHLMTDWITRRRPLLKSAPFVLAAPDHGRMLVKWTNVLAEKQGIHRQMAVADARAIIPSLEVIDDQPEIPGVLLKGIAEWSIRFTPAVAIDLPGGLLLDVTGCAHLWGGEQQYLAEITKKLTGFGYEMKAAIADTIGTAWAIARFSKKENIVEPGQQFTALQSLAPAALRLEPTLIERIEKLGLRQIKNFIGLPRTALRRRFGSQILERLDQALGHVVESFDPVCPVEPYQERLPCLEPILTATGIEIALTRLLDTLCTRLQKEEKGLRIAAFKCYRVDGKIEIVTIGTNRPSSNPKHIFKLFENKIGSIEPALGIELFTLEGSKVEEKNILQESLWTNEQGLIAVEFSELIDRIEGKMGPGKIFRYLPDEHYWPERSFRLATAIDELPQTNWRTEKQRPLFLLPKPQVIEVTAPIPDYPPMLFRYKGRLHKIVKADGPERIEQEWWIQEGKHRDYYKVEDEEGKRYWLFRSGHYDAERSYQWFLHGFFP